VGTFFAELFEIFGHFGGIGHGSVAMFQARFSPIPF
jgi:hypothetical protein